MINSLYIAFGCFIIALLALSQISCVQQPRYEVGTFNLFMSLTIQNDWCDMPDGELVNGTTTYSPKIPSVSAICISKQSDDIERTILHEFKHALDNATRTPK